MSVHVRAVLAWECGAFGAWGWRFGGEPTTLNIMSTQQPHTPDESTPEGAAAVPQPAVAETPPAAHRQLSPFLKVSIGLLAVVSIASIALLFLGDFEGKFERVFSTFILFAVFTTFTALDTRRETRSEWYAPVALIANTYILGLALIVIWITPYDFTLIFTIFWKSIFIIGVTRIVILGCELLLRLGNNRPAPLGRFAFITSVLAVLSGILFTAPTGIEAFKVTIPDLYWKIAVATLILTALGLAITLLLRWNYAAEERDARRAAAPAQPAPLPQVQPLPLAQYPAGQYPGQQDPALAPAPQIAAAQQPELLPWPLFADGTPLPADANGQPDFSVLQPPQA